MFTTLEKTFVALTSVPFPDVALTFASGVVIAAGFYLFQLLIHAIRGTIRWAMLQTGPYLLRSYYTLSSREAELLCRYYPEEASALISHAPVSYTYLTASINTAGRCDTLMQQCRDGIRLETHGDMLWFVASKAEGWQLDMIETVSDLTALNTLMMAQLKEKFATQAPVAVKKEEMEGKRDKDDSL
jgi:hypothetical protein